MPNFTRLEDGKLGEVPDLWGTIGELYSATIVVGAEVPNVINVTIQLTDFKGDDLATVACLQAYLSDNSDGSTVGTAHSTSPAIGTDGLLQVLLTDLIFLLTSESDGDIDINFEDDGTQTIYLVLIMPNGTLVISDAITHAA